MRLKFDHPLFVDPFQILISSKDAPDPPVAMGFLKTLPHFARMLKKHDLLENYGFPDFSFFWPAGGCLGGRRAKK